MITGPRSHWTMAWCGGPNSIIGSSYDYSYGDNTGGLVNTGIHGILFEMKNELEGTVVTYSFTLDGVYDVGAVAVE